VLLMVHRRLGLLLVTTAAAAVARSAGLHPRRRGLAICTDMCVLTAIGLVAMSVLLPGPCCLGLSLRHCDWLCCQDIPSI
jgi:hypothetical protein